MTTTNSTTTKRGATFGRAGTFPIPPGTWDVTATVREADGTLVDHLTCTAEALEELDANGNTVALAITATATQTADWPVKTLVCDIRFEDTGGNVLHTSTFLIVVQEEVTAS